MSRIPNTDVLHIEFKMRIKYKKTIFYSISWSINGMEILIGDAVNKKYAKTIQRFRRQHFGEIEGEPNPDQGFYYKEKYFGSGNVLHLLLTPYKGLSGPKKKNLQGSKEIFKHKISSFFFSGTNLSCLDYDPDSQSGSANSFQSDPNPFGSETMHTRGVFV
jgi:hypothetical protein